MKNEKQQLKIALLSPKGPLYRHPSGIFKKLLRAAPLTLTTLAALVPKEISCSIQMFDEGIESIPNHFEADLVGITVITGSAPRSYELAKKYRKEGKTVVLGGPHITLMPDEAVEHADAVVVGYAEETWPELIRDYVNGFLQKRYDMSGDFSFEKLNDIPFPRRDLLDKRKYNTINTFEAIRGCVHNCDFCVVPSAWGKRPFKKPISHVIDDIRQLGARRIIFYDLNLIADRSYAKELFTALIPLNIKWFGLSTALLCEDPEMLELIVKSGCLGLLIGFESLSYEGLVDINKRFHRPKLYSEVIRQLHELGIAIMGTFMFGNDHDDKNCFELVKSFVIDNKIELPRYSILTPFPGTPLFANLDGAGRIITRDWSLYDGQHVVFKPNKITEEELLQGHEKIWRESYELTSILRRILRRMPNLPTVLAANFGYRFYAYNLSRFYTCQGGLI